MNYKLPEAHWVGGGQPGWGARGLTRLSVPMIVGPPILRPGLAQIIPEEAQDDSELRRAFDQFDEKIDHWIEKEKVPA
jgi:hypothetical protein